MDSPESVRRVLRGDAAPLSYVVPVTGVRGQPSIYAALVAEWRAKGRAVPGRRDTAWDGEPASEGQGQAVTSWAVGRCAGLAPAADAGPAGARYSGEPDRVPAVVVPRGLPGPMFVWEGSARRGRVGVADPLTSD
ncbi:hypothetical protein ACFQ6S_36090 [Streptomyces sp. NPDC056479]|uniref:hypothetical protein n=1 Tax=Streptomyces sp. NPDC056479 TaxID=3345832 RepID=UPI00367EA52B